MCTTNYVHISSNYLSDNIASFFILTYNQAPYYAQPITADYANVRGKQTGTRVRILGTSTYLHSVTFYDAEGRVIQTRGANITGGYDILTTQYDFTGKVLRTVHRHDKQGTMARFAKVNTIYEYDHMGRILEIRKKIGTVERTIVANTYDEIGKVKTRAIGDNLETQTQEYNVRGWLLGVNRPYITGASSTNYFAYELAYDNNQSIVPGTTYNNPQYNGNIAGLIWKSVGDFQSRSFDFQYDAAHRLKSADFNQYTNGYFNKQAGMDFSVTGLTYDFNGNILTQTQKGWKVGSSGTIDNLTYGYLANSNKLTTVTDAEPATSKLGDFNDGNKTGDDYAYDENGNLNLDKNKGITSILYTHLNMPYEINIAGKGKITYTYDNLGTKLKKVVTDNTVTPAKTTTWLYIQNFVYKNDTMQFFAHEEGRARYDVSEGTGEAKKFDFDYFLKDHLGNVRMVLTEEKDTASYPPATVESATIANEQLYYDIKTAQVKQKSTIVNPPTQTSFGNALYRVHGGIAGEQTGLGIVLKVMATDKITLRAESFYNLPGGNAGSPVTLALTDLLGAFVGSGALAGKGLTVTDISNIGNNTSLLNPLTSGTTPSNVANAHLNVVLFDDQFKVVSTFVDPVETGGGYKNHTNFINNPINVSRNGYLYIFVSNKSNLEVFFDNLTVTHYKGPILEETHYYPFGLMMAGISSRALGKTENKLKFNSGSELQNKEFADNSGLDWYYTSLRMYDPQLGRWNSLDTKPNHMFSLYSGMDNNPILKNDPFGDTTVVDRRGTVVRRYGTDNLIFLQRGKRLSKIGEFGKSIDGNRIIKNMLRANVATAKSMWNPFTFYNLVKNKGEWDLKNNKNTLYGLVYAFDWGKNEKTQFEFQGRNMTAEALGNFHYGVVGSATKLFTSEFLLRQAGAAQMRDGTSRPEWQKHEIVPRYYPSASMEPVKGPLLPPYGDDPKDQQWIKEGFQYYTNNANELQKPEED